MSYSTIKQTPIHLLLLDNTPSGPRSIANPTRAGVGLLIPRADFPELRTRQELEQPGVYILIGEDENLQESSVYIGETDFAEKRLKSHNRHKDFWSRLFVFTSKSLNKAHVQHLEHRLFDIAKRLKLCNLLNSNAPTPPPLGENDKTIAESFLEDILLFLPILGINFFETPTKKKPSEQDFYFKSRGVDAKGYESANGFTVREGSRAIKRQTCKAASVVLRVRKQLVKKGILVDKGNFYELTQDYEFNSPSLAGACMVCATCGGRVAWKTKDGRTLKEIQEERE